MHARVSCISASAVVRCVRSASYPIKIAKYPVRGVPVRDGKRAFRTESHVWQRSYTRQNALARQPSRDATFYFESSFSDHVSTPKILFLSSLRFLPHPRRPPARPQGREYVGAGEPSAGQSSGAAHFHSPQGACLPEAEREGEPCRPVDLARAHAIVISAAEPGDRAVRAGARAREPPRRLRENLNENSAK